MKWEKKIYKWDKIIVDIDISEIKIWIEEVLVKIFGKIEIENKIGIRTMNAIHCQLFYFEKVVDLRIFVKFRKVMKM